MTFVHLLNGVFSVKQVLVDFHKAWIWPTTDINTSLVMDDIAVSNKVLKVLVGPHFSKVMDFIVTNRRTIQTVLKLTDNLTQIRKVIVVPIKVWVEQQNREHWMEINLVSLKTVVVNDKLDQTVLTITSSKSGVVQQDLRISVCNKLT